MKTNDDIDDKIRDAKLEYGISREAAKILALSSGKIDKYEYLTGVKTLPSNQRRVIEQAKFTYSSLEKALEKQRIELVKIDFNIDRDSIPLEEQKK